MNEVTLQTDKVFFFIKSGRFRPSGVENCSRNSQHNVNGKREKFKVGPNYKKYKIQMNMLLTSRCTNLSSVF